MCVRNGRLETKGVYMTDEEMAENSFDCKKLGYKVSADKRSYIDGFLDGLKAGEDIAAKWHKVTDGDYPKNSNQPVLGVLKDSKFVIGHLLVECTYSKESGWSDCYGGSLYNEVEYWTEIDFPKIKDE